MKSRQDKTGEQKFSCRKGWLWNQPLAGLGPMRIWEFTWEFTREFICERVSRTARLPHVFVILGFAAMSIAPALAARAPYLGGTVLSGTDLGGTAPGNPAAREVTAPDIPFPSQPGFVAGPTIERVVMSASGAIRVEGRGAPFSSIHVGVNAKPVGQPTAGADGRWRLNAAVDASSGDIVITTSARDTGALWPVPGHAVHVALPSVSLAAQDHAQPSRSYEYARIGLLSKGPETIVTRVRVAGDAWSETGNLLNPTLRAGNGKPFKLAQADTAPAAPSAASPPKPAADAIVPPVKREAPKTPAEEPATVPAAAPAAPELSAPPAQPAAAPEKKQQPAPPQSASKAPPPPPDVGGMFSRVQDWLARANREYQGTIVKQLSRPSTGGADAVAAAKKREIETAVEATKAAEAKRLEDEKKRAEQAKAEAAKSDTAKATEARKKAEELKQAAEKRAVEDAKKAATAKPADDQKASEEQKKAEAAKQVEAAKQADAAKKLEEQKRADGAAKSAAAEKTETARDVEAEKLRAANEAARLGEQKRVEEQKRAEQLRQLEAKRKSVEDAQRKSDEAQRKADEAKRNAQARVKSEERPRTEPSATEQRPPEQRPPEQRQAEPRQPEPRQTESRQAEPRQAEPRASETAVDTSKHRRLTITINPEPIVRPRAEPTSGRPEVTPPAPEFKDQTLVADRSAVEDGVYAGGTRLRQRIRVYREATYRDTGRYARGPAVKRWVWRKYGACSAAGRKAFAPRRYVVRRGDSLWRISERHYNAGRLYSRIYRANRDRIRDPDLIYPCQRFLLPRR